MHDLRESYRRKAWEIFTKKQRKAARELSQEKYNEEQAKMARANLHDPVLATLAMWGFMPPACMIHRKGEVPTECPWGCKGSGDHHHIFWECGYRTPQIRRPDNKVQARLRWPDPKKDSGKIVNVKPG